MYSKPSHSTGLSHSRLRLTTPSPSPSKRTGTGTGTGTTRGGKLIGITRNALFFYRYLYPLVMAFMLILVWNGIKSIASSLLIKTDGVYYADKLDFVTFDDSGFHFVTPKEPKCSKKLTEDDIDFTLVTQTTMNRLNIMEYQCRFWGDHPISIAIYSGTDTVQSVLKELQQYGCNVNYVTVQILNPEPFPEYSFPVNALRNMAMSGVKTSHVVYVDIELLISENLYENLKYQRKYLTESHMNALILPTFEFMPACRKNGTACYKHDLSDVPTTKEDLLKVWSGDLLEQPIAQQFYAEFKWGQSTTPFKKWEKQKKYEQVDITCMEIDENGYFHWEPYVILQYCDKTPLFQESFMWYGYEKSSWIKELVYKGYRFATTGGGYVIHLPHEKSDVSKIFYNSNKLQEVTKQYEVFSIWLQQHTNPNQLELQPCPK